MIILEDTRNQVGRHAIKNARFDELGVEIRRTKLYVGDYTLPTNQSVCVDTKEHIQELISDICGKQHDRFRAECERAKESGIQLYILVENKGEYVDYKKTIYQKPVTSLKELYSWKNKRAFIWRNGKQLYPTATKGSTLAKACQTMELKYGVKFEFCTPEKSADKILELLGVKDGKC